jgi:hypothetical protein
MRWWVVVVSVLAGCFTPRFAECKIRCGDGCPGDWSCGADGFCHDEEDRCASGVDAASEPDATVVTSPDAAACTTTDLAINGGFDSSTGEGADKTVPGWGLTPDNPGRVIKHDSEVVPGARSAPYQAWPSFGENRHDLLCQPVAIPAQATEARLRFALQIATLEPLDNATYDELAVLAGALELDAFSNLRHDEEFVVHELELPSGSFEVCFDAKNDATFATRFALDDVQILVTVCPQGHGTRVASDSW